jgi:hypothetical protein
MSRHHLGYPAPLLPLNRPRRLAGHVIQAGRARGRAPAPRPRPVRFLRSERTGRRQRALFQRQKTFRDRLMLRHFREKAEPLAVDREVSRLFAARRKPVAIKVERGGVQIVRVADDAQPSPRISPALICSPLASRAGGFMSGWDVTIHICPKGRFALPRKFADSAVFTDVYSRQRGFDASARSRRRSWRSDTACSRIELGTTKAGVSTPG